jgi:two-component sensor histidine kinase
VTQHLNVDNGLIGSNIKCITSHDGILYAATDKCVNIRYPNGKFTYIKQANGINAKEINAISIINDKIYLATIRGLFYMPVDLSFTNIVSPKIRISSFKADDKQYPIDKNIGLPYDNNDILITFSGIALRSRTAMKYYYRIIGNVEKWQELPGSINYVRLNNLAPGTYEFQLKAANEDGILSDKTATLNIIVATPLWQKWWFISLLIIIVSTTVGIIFIVRIRNIKKKAEILNKITESQLTALKAQMNPHFMYNTLNSIQDLVLQKDVKNTNYYLSRYSTLMRKILEISEQNQVDLNEEIEILKLYLELEQLRFGADFEFSIVCDLNINQNTIFIPSMIIQPFVENAIKHGLLHKKGSKSLVIRFENHAEAIICTIKDNGVGRQKAAEIKSRSPMAHKSFATNATQKRLELININRKNKITLEFTDLYSENVATGTEVKITIPYYLNQS